MSENAKVSTDGQAIPAAATNATKTAVTAPASNAKAEVNPRLTKVYMDLKNSDMLLELSKRFASIALKQPEIRPARQNNWFDRTDLTRNAETSDGDTHIIDVQPDYRFPFSYICYACVQNYPRLDVKSHPSFSLYSYIAYEIILFSSFLLVQDTFCRGIRSQWAQQYQNDHERADYFRRLQECHMSQELARLIENFATVFDPSKPDCAFVPTLAGGKFAHDFGRLIPAPLFLTMHNLLARCRTSTPVHEILRQFYDTLIITVNNRAYYSTHFVGGYYTAVAQTNVTQTWLRDIIEAVFAPALGRSHIQRPTLAQINIHPQVYPEADPNFYDITLCYNPEDFPAMMHFISNMSSFYQNTSDIGSVPLYAVAEKVGGITILTHTVESMTLPTWHYLAHPATPVTDARPVNEISTAQLATYTHFLTPEADYNQRLPFPADPAEIDPQLYLVGEEAYNPAEPNYDMMIFDAKQHINPDVFIFSPYERNINRATISLALGIKIQTDEIDAAVIPLPNPQDSLFENNSAYMQGSLPESSIKPVCLRSEANNHIRVVKRARASHLNNGLAIRDAGLNAIPVFANANVQAGVNALNGFSVEDNHRSIDYSHTYTGWYVNADLDFRRRTRYVWSSYRHVQNANTQNRIVNFYYSLRPMYGTSVPLLRARNPSIIVPRG